MRSCKQPLRAFRRIPLGHKVRVSSREQVFLREMWRSFLASWHVLQRESEIRWSRYRRDWVKPVRKCLGWDGKLVVWVNCWPSELCDACGKIPRFFCPVQGTRHSLILQTVTDYFKNEPFLDSTVVESHEALVLEALPQNEDQKGISFKGVKLSDWIVIYC